LGVASPDQKGIDLSRLALLLAEGKPTRQHLQVARVLDFFGVPWETVELSELADVEGDRQNHVVFGPAQTVEAALKQIQVANGSVPRQAACYVYSGDDLAVSESGLHSMCGNTDFVLRQAPTGNLSIRVSRELPDVTGPMAGIEFWSRLRKEDAVLVGVPGEGSRFETVISAGGAPVFVRFHTRGMPVFFCASSHVVDIDQNVSSGFYDVRDHFCSVVPLVMFIRLMFREVAWRCQELGACLIIDDPLLRPRYGSCDFGLLSSLMKRYGFTTNVAFIPWNWRRTSSTAGDFFRNEPERFSVSIHGCDHIGAEFGETSPAVLNNRAKLAQSRMRNHEARTGIHHDPIMIFPQGVFSSVCPDVLKRNGFLAAVNTETVPADPQSVGTRIRDVWDVAITTYGGFPIFTRRYDFHGLENFAFDLLLGKPCLIVSHHGFFKDGCVGLIELIEKLGSLNCNLRWRPLGDVIRRACRRRVQAVGVEEVEMYGNELLIDNPSDQAITVRVRKRENQADLVAEVRCDQSPVLWTTEADYLVFDERIGPRSERHFQVFYREQAEAEKVNRSFRFELSVAARRFLCEFRDDYLSKSDFLSVSAASLKNVLTKGN
jgi:hypothetical protein